MNLVICRNFGTYMGNTLYDFSPYRIFYHINLKHDFRAKKQQIFPYQTCRANTGNSHSVCIHIMKYRH